MSKALLLVRTGPKSPEAEDEYNAWYTDIHIPQILAAVPAITGAQRFRLLSAHGQGADPAPYLAVYEIESDDPQSAVDLLGQAMAAGDVVMSDSVVVLGSAPLWVEAGPRPTEAQSS
jgi:hypothetical protein